MNLIARVCCGILLLALPGCEWIVDRIIVGDSPHCNRPPRVESLTGELAIVRVMTPPVGETRELYLDRLKYLAVKDSVRSRNRVVIARASTSDVSAIEWGDTVRVTTKFAGLVQTKGYEKHIPDWSANEGQCFDGAWVAWHRLVSIAPMGPPQ